MQPALVGYESRAGYKRVAGSQRGLPVCDRRGQRAVGRASGDGERQAAEARDSCAGMAARDAGAVGRAGGVPAGVSGARGRGPGRTQVGWPRRKRKPDGAELCGVLGDRGATCEVALDGSARPASMSSEGSEGIGFS